MAGTTGQLAGRQPARAGHLLPPLDARAAQGRVDPARARLPQPPGERRGPAPLRRRSPRAAERTAPVGRRNTGSVAPRDSSGTGSWTGGAGDCDIRYPGLPQGLSTHQAREVWRKGAQSTVGGHGGVKGTLWGSKISWHRLNASAGVQPPVPWWHPLSQERLAFRNLYPVHLSGEV